MGKRTAALPEDLPENPLARLAAIAKHDNASNPTMTPIERAIGDAAVEAALLIGIKLVAACDALITLAQIAKANDPNSRS